MNQRPVFSCPDRCADRHAEAAHPRDAIKGAPLTMVTAIAAVLASAMLLLAGCASPGAPTQPHAITESKELGATATTGTPWPEARWWTAYGDAELNRLVDLALADQPNLQTTQARLQQAQAAVDVAGAARLPQVNGTGNLTRQRFTENGLVPPPLAGSQKWNNDLQVGLSWELDLFGRQRAALESAIGQLRAAEAETQAARMLLAGNVATAYFNLARLVEARSVAAQAQVQREQVLSLIRQRIDAGLDTSVELRQGEGLIAQTRVDTEALTEMIGRARHALAELVGQGPQTLDGLAPTLASVKPRPLPATLPADLLGRRADLVAQRWRVEAASREVDVARAQFYPNVNLAAFVGLSSIGLDRLIEAGSLTYGAGPAIRLPIFEGGRLRANLSAKNAEVDIAVEAYNSALLRALREVSDEIGSLQSLERQQRAQAQATAAADAAYSLALQRYQGGLGNFLTVLTAETNVLAQRRNATDLKGRHLAAEIALQRALGGGFEATPELMPTAMR